MLIEWKGTGLKIIPYKTQGNYGAKAGVLTLLPGVNEVATNAWELARVNVLEEVKAGMLRELRAQIEETQEKIVIEKPVLIKDADDKLKTVMQPHEVEAVKFKVIKNQEFGELPLDKAEQYVRNTYNLDTLRKWKAAESRDSIRAALSQQIENIMNYGNEKTKTDNEKLYGSAE